MRTQSIRLVMGVVLCLAVSAISFGQAQKKAAEKNEKKAPAPAKNFDPRDFTGFWEGPPPGERPAEEARPAFTPQGAELQKKRMPIYISKTERLKNVENPGCR